MTIDDLHKKDHEYLKRLVIRTLRARPNRTMAKDKALDECLGLLRSEGALTGRLSGSPRHEFGKRINMAMKALKRSGKVDYYFTATRERVRLV